MSAAICGSGGPAYRCAHAGYLLSRSTKSRIGASTRRAAGFVLEARMGFAALYPSYALCGRYFLMAMNVEAEIRELKRRVSEIKGSFGFLTQQIKGIHKDLLTFQARTEQNFEKVNGRLDKHDARFDRLDK